MSEVSVSKKRVVDQAGIVLFEEVTNVTRDGSSLCEATERTVIRCPTCKSPLDQSSYAGQCWECGKPLCTNCATTSDCGRKMCPAHAHIALLKNERIPVCSEHEPLYRDRQALYDQVALVMQELERQEKELEILLKERNMQLKEADAVAERMSRNREQAFRIVVAGAKLRLEQARLQLEQMRVIAPTTHSLLQSYGRALPSPRGRWQA